MGAPSYVPKGVVGDVLRDVLRCYEPATAAAVAAIASVAGGSEMVGGDGSVVALKDEASDGCKSSRFGSQQRSANDAVARKGEDSLQLYAKLRPRRAVVGLSARYRAPLLAVDDCHGVKSAILSLEQSCANKQQQHSIVQTSPNGQGTEANPTHESKFNARNKSRSASSIADIHPPVMIVEPKEQLEIWTRLLRFEAKLQVDTHIAAWNLLAIENVLEVFVDGEMKMKMQPIDGQGFGLRWERVLGDVDQILGKYRGGKIEKAWWREFRMWRYLLRI